VHVRRLIALADAVNVALASLLGVLLLARLAGSAGRLEPVAFACGLGLGYAAADVASGLTHWFCDTYFAPSTPVVGPMIIAPFREHHVDPEALARHGVLERNGNNCLAALPLLLAALWSLAPVTPQVAWLDALRGFLVALSVTLCLTNQIHAWAHSAQPPRVVHALQRAGVLLAPERHRAHHRGERAYAVVSGWSNTLLDRVLARAERVLAACGVAPSESSGGAQP
jgi:ubiquitin-conjugating enzyme E2 variant